MSIAEIVLASGRDIDLVHLEVSGPGTMLEGYPNRRLNDAALEAVRASAQRRYPHAGILVIEPPRIRQPAEDGWSGPFGPVEHLPPIRCLGVFSSHHIDEDADSVLVGSALVVVWYQHEPILPFDAAALDMLRALDWDALARDHDR